MSAFFFLSEAWLVYNVGWFQVYSKAPHIYVYICIHAHTHIHRIMYIFLFSFFAIVGYRRIVSGSVLYVGLVVRLLYIEECVAVHPKLLIYPTFPPFLLW